MNEKLFRQAAIEHQRARLWGDTLHIRPLNFLLLIVLILGFTLSTLFFLVQNNYARKESVAGHLVSNKDEIAVGPAKAGRIQSINIALNESVAAGDELFRVQLDQMVRGKQQFTEEVLGSLAEQESILTEQINLQQSLLEAKLEDSQELSHSLASRIAHLESLISNQNVLVEVKENAHFRAQGLAEKRFIAKDQLDTLFVAYLQEKNTLENFRLQKFELIEEQQKLQQYRDVQRREYQERILTLQAEKATLQHEVINARYQSDNSVLAPIDGTVRAISYAAGDYVNPGQRVVLLTPPDAKFEAELFVPSSAVGFLELGQEANIRFEAFPYQKFGMQSGYIATISNTVLMPDEIPANINIAEPVYRVRVRLDKQSMLARGKELPLRSGMLLQATLIQERRSLMEWLLEPLYSVLGSRSAA